MIEVRPFSKITDFKDLNEFTVEHGWPPFNPLILPTIGVCVYEDDKKLCFGWLYLESSTIVAMVEWIVTNPKNTPRESLKSIKISINHLVGIAKKLGYSFIFTSAENKGLIKLYEKAGFEQTDKKMTHLVYKGD